MTMPRARSWSISLLVGVACAIPTLHCQVAVGQGPQAAELDAEAARQQQIVDRFLSVLERNPRRGTALDRIYGFYVETGTLDGFLRQLREAVEKNPGDGAKWM